MPICFPLPSPFNVLRGRGPIPLGLGTTCGKVSPHVTDVSRLEDFGSLYLDIVEQPAFLTCCL